MKDSGWRGKQPLIKGYLTAHGLCVVCVWRCMHRTEPQKHVAPPQLCMDPAAEHADHILRLFHSLSPDKEQKGGPHSHCRYKHGLILNMQDHCQWYSASEGKSTFNSIQKKQPSRSKSKTLPLNVFQQQKQCTLKFTLPRFDLIFGGHNIQLNFISLHRVIYPTAQLPS